MTLTPQVHDLVEDLPEDSPLLIEVREALRMNRALGERSRRRARRARLRSGGVHGKGAGTMAAQSLRVIFSHSAWTDIEISRANGQSTPNSGGSGGVKDAQYPDGILRQVLRCCWLQSSGFTLVSFCLNWNGAYSTERGFTLISGALVEANRLSLQ